MKTVREKRKTTARRRPAHDAASTLRRRRRRYYKSLSDNGLSIWTPQAAVFPSGADAAWTGGSPLVLHNRWVSPSSPYYNESDPAYDPEAYGRFAWAPFDPAAGDTVVLPIDAAFFTTLMAPAAAWGMVTYEQDFLTAQYETVAAKQLGVEDAHLDAMHAAAASLNVTIQCVDRRARAERRLLWWGFSRPRGTGEWR